MFCAGKGNGSHGGVAIRDIDLSRDGVGSILDLSESVTYARVLQGRHNGEKLHVLDCLNGQPSLQIVFKQFLGHLDDAYTWGDRLAGEMSLVDSVVGLQADVVADGSLSYRLALNHV